MARLMIAESLEFGPGVINVQRWRVSLGCSGFRRLWHHQQTRAGRAFDFHSPVGSITLDVLLTVWTGEGGRVHAKVLDAGFES